MKTRDLGYILSCIIALLVLWSTFHNDYGNLTHSNPPFKQRLPLREDETARIIQTHYHSSLYNVTYTSLGLILRVSHMTKATRQMSEWSVSGDGLHNASVGNSAHIAVNIGNLSLPKFQKRSYISVLAVGRNHIFVVNPCRESRTRTGLTVHFTYIPTLRGNYDLYIEEIGDSIQRQLPGSPFRLTVNGPQKKPVEKRMESDRKPSCQTIPQNNYTWLDGEWITRTFAGTERGTLRSGWVFQPKVCSFDIFTKEDLALASSSPTTIVVLGTSTERGIFLTLIDLALYNHEKYHLDISDVGKCWGYARLSLGNLTFIYQDLRLFSVSSSAKDQITCHNEKLAGNSLQVLKADAVAFVRDFLFKDDQYIPDVILVLLRDARQLRLVVNQIPSEWNGTIYAVNNFRSKFGVFYTRRGQEANAREMKQLSEIDPRVQLFNGFHLGAGMRHSTESSPFIMRANHFHRFCNELNGEMRVCGNPTEMAAQMLLGKAIAPNGKQKWELFRKPTKSISRDIKICYDCPASLLPVHVKRIPQLKCYKSNVGFKPRNESNVKVWDGSLCPKECMDTEPVEEMYTQTDIVQVRVCTPLT